MKKITIKEVRGYTFGQKLFNLKYKTSYELPFLVAWDVLVQQIWSRANFLAQ